MMQWFKMLILSAVFAHGLEQVTSPPLVLVPSSVKWKNNAHIVENLAVKIKDGVFEIGHGDVGV